MGWVESMHEKNIHTTFLWFWSWDREKENLDSKKEGGKTHNTLKRDEGVGRKRKKIRIQKREQKEREKFEQELREEEEKLRKQNEEEKRIEYEEKKRVRQEVEFKRKEEEIERKEIILREVKIQHPIAPCIDFKGGIPSFNSSLKLFFHLHHSF